jgi:uncharacterized membrane protein YgaE (UPF0421/DUF939 family)
MTTIYDVLKKDHREVKALFKKLEPSLTTRSAESVMVFDTIKPELGSHLKAEWDIFDMPLRMRIKTPMQKRMLSEVERNYRVAVLLLNELSQAESNSPDWFSKASVLVRSVRHYFSKEEHEIFRLARTYFSRAEAEEIALRMEEKKNEYKARLNEALQEDVFLPMGYDKNRSEIDSNYRMHHWVYADAKTDFTDLNNISQIDKSERKAERGRE